VKEDLGEKRQIPQLPLDPAPVNVYKFNIFTSIKIFFIPTTITVLCLQISEGWVSGGWGQALFSGAQ